jgi:hypothetical protein
VYNSFQNQRIFAYHLHHVLPLTHPIQVHVTYYNKYFNINMMMYYPTNGTKLTLIKISPVSGEIIFVRKRLRLQMKIVGELDALSIMTLLNHRGVYILIRLSGKLVGRLIFRNKMLTFLFKCKDVRFLFERSSPPRIRIIVTHVSSSDHMAFVCSVLRKRAKNMFYVCNSGDESTKHVAFSTNGNLWFFPNFISYFSVLRFYHVKKRRIRQLRVSFSEKVEVKFVFVNDEHRRLIIGITENRIILIDVRKASLHHHRIHRIRLESVNTFLGTDRGHFVLLNRGDLVQFVTDVARPDGARNLTMLRIYSPYLGCGANGRVLVPWH